MSQSLGKLILLNVLSLGGPLVQSVLGSWSPRPSWCYQLKGHPAMTNASNRVVRARASCRLSCSVCWVVSVALTIYVDGGGVCLVFERCLPAVAQDDPARLTLRGGSDAEGGRMLRARILAAPAVLSGENGSGDVNTTADGWGSAALQRRVAELKAGGPLKDFIDGLVYRKGAPPGVPHLTSAVDAVRPFDRFALPLDPEDLVDSEEDRVNMANLDRLQRAYLRARRGEAMTADSSSQSSAFGSLVWDSEKLQEAFPSEEDDDPLAYKCEYIEGPRFLKYTSARRMERWHAVARERFDRLQAMDSDEFVNGIDDELKYERDIFQERIVTVNGSKFLVSKAPFFEGEAGYVGKNREAIAGSPVRFGHVLNNEESALLEPREQALFDELYGELWLDKSSCSRCMRLNLLADVDLLCTAGTEWIEKQNSVFDKQMTAGNKNWEDFMDPNVTKSGVNGSRNDRRFKRAQIKQDEGLAGNRVKMRTKIAEFEGGDWPTMYSGDMSLDDTEAGGARRCGHVEGDSDLDFPIILSSQEDGRIFSGGERVAGVAGQATEGEQNLFLGDAGPMPMTAHGPFVSRLQKVNYTGLRSLSDCLANSTAQCEGIELRSRGEHRQQNGSDRTGRHDPRCTYFNDPDPEVRWAVEQEEDECSCVEKTVKQLEEQMLWQVREHPDEIFPCATSGYGTRVMLSEKWRLQLQYALNDQFWLAVHQGDAPEASRLLSLGAEVNLEVWVRSASTQQPASPMDSDGESAKMDVLTWRVADENLWGNTPLDRLIKFGGDPDCRLVAEAVCAFVVGGTRVDRAKAERASAAMQWRQSAERILTELENRPEAWPFLKPVTEKEAPGYFQEVSRPMDLSTVRAKLHSHQYRSSRVWQADLRLMLANALQYNRPKDIVYKLAVELGRVLEAKVEADPQVQADLARVQEQRFRQHSPLPVRVAQGWAHSVPAPINHTEVRRLRDERRRAYQPMPSKQAASEEFDNDMSSSPRVYGDDKKVAFAAVGGLSHLNEKETIAAREEKMWRKECARAFMRVWKHKEAWPFIDPVDPAALQIPTYFDIIKQPMDLGTIKIKLHENKYVKADEFAFDMRLVFENAMTFNPKDHWVAVMAANLRKLFDDAWIESTMRLERKRIELLHL